MILFLCLSFLSSWILTSQPLKLSVSCLLCSSILTSPPSKLFRRLLTRLSVTNKWSSIPWLKAMMNLPGSIMNWSPATPVGLSPWPPLRMQWVLILLHWRLSLQRLKEWFRIFWSCSSLDLLRPLLLQQMLPLTLKHLLRGRKLFRLNLSGRLQLLLKDYLGSWVLKEQLQAQPQQQW